MFERTCFLPIHVKPGSSLAPIIDGILTEGCSVAYTDDVGCGLKASGCNKRPRKANRELGFTMLAHDMGKAIDVLETKRVTSSNGIV